MGLNVIGISKSFLCLPEEFNPWTQPESYFCIVAYTTTDTIKLYYCNTDSKNKIEDLLEQNGMNKTARLSLLSEMGFSLVEHKNHSSLASDLPGIKLKTKHPVTGTESRLYDIIMDLNDRVKWPREEIAQWIENTFDIKDIAFDSPEGVMDEADTISKFTKVVKIQRVLSS